MFFERDFMKKVAIVMGSDSDVEIAKKAVAVLKDYSVETEVFVLSAHRTPEQTKDFAQNAKKNGFGVIIAIAGKAAHLAGVIASMTTLPVIGVPVKSSALEGLDALLAVVQMPQGVPVATVAIDGGANAGILAVQILAVNDEILEQKLADQKQKAVDSVLAKNQKIHDQFKN